ncbi:MAG TPA: glycosyltransferase family 4 protein [Candidatus Binataceae bacterium]|nr:glycosyltransferase family 4 protein [Candidatus Binataceae bacterium]
MTSPYRIACLVSHPIQYQAPMFRYLAASPEIDLTVLFLSDLSVREYHDPGFGVAFKWDVPLLEGYRSEFLPAFGAIDEISFWRPFTRRIRRRLREGRFDALWVHGYAHQAMLRAIAAARSLGIKVLMRGDSNIANGAGSPARRALKARILPRLFSAIDGFLSVGARNREYYLAYGVPEAKMFSMPYAVDNDFFRARAEAARPAREQFRCKLGLAPGRPIILYVGKIYPGKRAGDLVQAWLRLPRELEPHPYLLLVGDGNERAHLQTLARESGLEHSILFPGFRNQSDLPQFYDLCDVLVLPSASEAWGLVLNEVMNAAKPVIASDAVGAAPDLVIDGANGFIYPVGDIGALARALERITRSPEHAAAMGAKSLEIVSRYSFAAGRAGLLAALAAVTARAAEN